MEVFAALAAAGFDIAHTFDAAAAAAEPSLAMLAGTARLGILIGNTRALWPLFTAALRDPALAAERDPLERYTERVIDAAFDSIGQATGESTGPRLYYGHRRYAGGYIPMQRLATATGLGALAPSHLVIHPVYGPWFALRAVVLLDGDPPVRSAIAKPCQCDGTCEARFARARTSSDRRDWLAARDACSLRTWRYSDDQLQFHYLRLCQTAR
jgi:methylmalonic aciduria homocystinuria type C protein